MAKFPLASVKVRLFPVILIYEETNVTVQATLILVNFKEHSDYR